MAKTSNVFVRVEPNVKEEAEIILTQLGIPMSNAVSMFLKQVVLQRGIPFDMKLPNEKPLCINNLSNEELMNELEKGFDDIESGRVHSLESIKAEFNIDYEL